MTLLRALLVDGSTSPNHLLNDDLTNSIWSVLECSDRKTSIVDTEGKGISKEEIGGPALLYPWTEFCSYTLGLLGESSQKLGGKDDEMNGRASDFFSPTDTMKTILDCPRICATLDLFLRVCRSSRYCQLQAYSMIMEEGGQGFQPMTAALGIVDSESQVGAVKHCKERGNSRKSKERVVLPLPSPHQRNVEWIIGFGTLYYALRITVATILVRLCSDCNDYNGQGEKDLESESDNYPRVDGYTNDQSYCRNYKSASSNIVLNPASRVGTVASVRASIDAFVTCVYGSNSNGQIKTLLSLALSQTFSRDLTLRTLCFHATSSASGYDYNSNNTASVAIFGDRTRAQVDALSCSSTVAKWSRQVAVLEGQVRGLNGSLKRVSRELITSKVEAEGTQCRAVARAKAEAGVKIKAAMEDRSVALRRKTKLEERLVEADARVNATKIEAKELSSKAEDYRSDINACSGHIVELEEMVRTLQNQMDENQGKLLAGNNELREEKGVNKELCTKLSDKEQQNKELSRDRDCIQDELENTCEKLISFFQVYKGKEEEKEKIRRDLLEKLNEAENKTERVIQKYNQSEDEIEALNGKNRELRRKLEMTVKKMKEDKAKRKPIGPVAYINSIHDESMRSGKFRGTGKENESSFTSKRMSRSSRHSNFRIAK